MPVPARMRIVDIEAAATHDLRGRVLRVGTTSTEVTMPGDDLDDTWHIGAELDGRLVAISTWMDRSHDTVPGDDMVPGTMSSRQLRGMATDPDPAVRGHGFGSLLLQAGVQRCIDNGYGFVWANSRSSVLGFYVAHGFDADGPEFISADTGLAHRRVVRRLV